MQHNESQIPQSCKYFHLSANPLSLLCIGKDMDNKDEYERMPFLDLYTIERWGGLMGT